MIQKYMPLLSFILLVIIAVHVRMSFEYNGHASNNLLTKDK